MKILHLSSEKSWRGGEQQIAYLIEELKGMGVDCHILSRENSEFSEYCRSKGWGFEEAPFRNSTDFNTAWKIKKYCQKNQIDLVHMHGSRAHGPGVISAALGNRAKLILSRRVDFPLKDNFMSRWKYNHPSIKRILCVSNEIQIIVERSIKRKDICRTVYSGIDLSRFDNVEVTNALRKQYGISDETMLIGNTSALADHKDYYTFVDTAQELLKRNCNVHFFIFGTGPMEVEIKQYVKDLNLTKDITFTGFVDNISELLPELDVFLMPSKTEGLGTSLLDAMACKVPIVATRAGGIPEIVIDGETGLSAPVKDSDKLADACIKFIENAELRNKIVDQAYSFVRKFDRKQTAINTEIEYRAVMKEA